MTEESCPLPSSNRRVDPEWEIIARMLRAQKIAVVGLSTGTSRAAWMIASYLQTEGRIVIPVNPNFDEVMGLKCFPTVQAIGERVDLVDVFRRAQFCPAVVEDAIAARAGGVWLQSGIVSREARRIAEEAGIEYVEKRCLMIEMMHGE